MIATSAGIMMHQRRQGELFVLLVHPGGPFWSRKDAGSWSIPKGEYDSTADPKEAALREFEEELGAKPAGELRPLGEVVQSGRKRVTAFALEGDFDIGSIRSNMFELEWPPRSGRLQSFPEIDRAGWFPLAVARVKILPGQRPFLDRLEAMCSGLAP
jgi:predicted NUDIX family NTP pyrophosphohydrolase